MILLGLLATVPATQALQDARLTRSLGDRSGAASALRAMVQATPPTDPVWVQAIGDLADLALDEGQHDEAAALVKRCLGQGAHARCVDLENRLVLETRAVTTLPSTWSFDPNPAGGPAAEDHGIVVFDGGTLTAGGGRLTWSHPRNPATPGTLMFAVDLPSGQTPRAMELSIGSVTDEAWVGVVLVDDRGRVYPSPAGVQRIEPKRANRIVVPLDEVENASARLAPGTLDRILIRDLSGLDDASGSQSVLWLDDVTLR